MSEVETEEVLFVLFSLSITVSILHYFGLGNLFVEIIDVDINLFYIYIYISMFPYTYMHIHVISIKNNINVNTCYT